MEPSRYLALFVEESTDHLGEMGRAFLALEKDPASGDALEICFRMAHSIKGMAASMKFEPIVARAHALEDRFAAARVLGRVDPVQELPQLFTALDELERLLTSVRDTGQCPVPSDASQFHAVPAGLKKKVRGLRRKARWRTSGPRRPSGSAPIPSIVSSPASAR